MGVDSTPRWKGFGDDLPHTTRAWAQINMKITIYKEAIFVQLEDGAPTSLWMDKWTSKEHQYTQFPTLFTHQMFLLRTAELEVNGSCRCST